MGLVVPWHELRLTTYMCYECMYIIILHVATTSYIALLLTISVAEYAHDASGMLSTVWFSVTSSPQDELTSGTLSS